MVRRSWERGCGSPKGVGPPSRHGAGQQRDPGTVFSGNSGRTVLRADVLTVGSVAKVTEGIIRSLQPKGPLEVTIIKSPTITLCHPCHEWV